MSCGWRGATLSFSLNKAELVYSPFQTTHSFSHLLLLLTTGLSFCGYVKTACEREERVAGGLWIFAWGENGQPVQPSDSMAIKVIGDTCYMLRNIGVRGRGRNSP